MPRSLRWPLRLLAAGALGAHAMRLDSVAELRPRNASTARRRTAAWARLLAAAPVGAGALDLKPPWRPSPPQKPRETPSAATDVAQVDAGGVAWQAVGKWLPSVASPLRDAIAGFMDLPEEFIARPAKSKRKSVRIPRVREDAAVFTYSRGDGVAVKDIRTATPSESRAVARQTLALELFGGGDVVRCLEVREENVRGSASRTRIFLEETDGDLRSGVMSREGFFGRVSADRKLRLIVELLRGVSKLEKAGWVHRNIRPESVFVIGDCFSAEGSHAKLAEFTYACPLESLSAVSSGSSVPRLVGTARYIPPEVWLGEEDLRKVDVWAAGLTIFELLTGGPPAVLAREGPDAVKELKSLVPEEFDIVADPGFRKLERRDAELAQLVRRMLTKPVSRRITVVEALKTARSIAAERGVAVPEQPMPSGAVRIGTRATRAVDGLTRKTAVYRATTGDVMKEVHTRGSEAGRIARYELEALELFRGGDVVSLTDSTVKRLDGDAVALFLDLEAADGNLRDDILGRDEVSMKVRLRMFIEVLRGLANMERGGWVHGDLAPEHILIFGDCNSEDDCHAKLGGLGSCRPLDAIDVDGIRVRRKRMSFRAPEVLKPGSDVSKMDVWSAGMVGLELFSGDVAAGATRPLPDAQALGEVLRMLEEDALAGDPRIKSLEQRDGDLARLIRSMTRMQVDQRLTAKEALRWASNIALRRWMMVPEQTISTKSMTRSIPRRPQQTKTKVYGAGNGVFIKEVSVDTDAEAAVAQNEIAALERFGGGDVVRLLAKRRQGAVGGRATYVLGLEAADSTFAEGVLQKERGLLPNAGGGISQGLKVRLIAELLRGVSKLEREGWVHGDIDPENVLVFGECFSQQGCHAKLAGLKHAGPVEAYAASLQDGAVGVPAAPRYRAPEVWRGEADLSKADVWSVGVLAFELFVGRLPVDGYDVEALAQGLDITRDMGWQRLQAKDPQVAKLIRRMLASRVANRPSAKVAFEWARSLARLQGVTVPAQRDVAKAAAPLGEPGG